MMKKASHWRFGLGLLVASVIVMGSIWSVAMQSAVVGADVTTAPFVHADEPLDCTGPGLGSATVLTAWGWGGGGGYAFVPVRPFVRSCYLPTASAFSTPWWS